MSTDDGKVVTGWVGRFYEDMEVGQTMIHSGGRTLSEADNTWFTLLTCNTHPLHFNADFAARTEFGRPLVNSCLTLSIVLGLSVTDTSLNTLANLGWEEIKLTAPVFAGDTLYAETEVLSKRESASRPYAGIVHTRTRGRNQDGVVVLEFQRSYMMYKRGHSPWREIARERERLVKESAAADSQSPST
ncbi:MAG: MaoC family dehydratase [Chloroflexota bacterium]